MPDQTRVPLWLRARMFLANRDAYFGKAERLASALLLSGVGGGERSRARTLFGLALTIADVSAQIFGRPIWDTIREWATLPEYEVLAPIYAHALGPLSQADVYAEGILRMVAGVPCLYVRDAARVQGDLERVIDAAREAAWAAVGPRTELVPLRGVHGSTLLALRSVAGDVRRTRQGDACIERLRPFLIGRPQSALLVGEPGSGKTTAAAQVAADLGGGRILRVSVSDLAAVPVATVRAAVRLLRPGALLIDDIDRHPNPGDLLDLFDEAGEYARLRVATCNFPRRLGSALLRPGRFDHHIRAEDPYVAAARRADAAEVLAGCAGALELAAFHEALTWPVAFTARLAEGSAVRGPAHTGDEFADLRRRLAEQRTLDSEAAPVIISADDAAKAAAEAIAEQVAA